MNKSGASLVVLAVIWAAVIVALGMVLKGTPQSTDVMTLVGGGAVATLILFGAAHRRSMRA